MAYHTWTTTLTVTTDNESVNAIRDWLAKHCADQPPPSRNDDALGKYMRLVLASNSEWDAVGLGFTLGRPKPLRAPWQAGWEAEPPPEPATIRNDRDATRRRQFAVDCFALLALLIVGATVFTARSLHIRPNIPSHSGYTASHDVPGRPQVRVAGETE